MSGSPGTPTERDTRPPIAGPIDRYLRYLKGSGPPLGSSSAAGALVANARSRSGRQSRRVQRIMVVVPGGNRSKNGVMALYEQPLKLGGFRRRRACQGLRSSNTTVGML